MKENIFKSIIDGKLPSYKIYEDEDIYVFLDTFPVSEGHTLVIPKKYYINMLDAPECISRMLFNKSCNIAKDIVKVLEAKGVNILTNCGKAAGQQVDYYHIHIIPRLKKINNLILEKHIDESNLTEEFFTRVQRKIITGIKKKY